MIPGAIPAIALVAALAVAGYGGYSAGENSARVTFQEQQLAQIKAIEDLSTRRENLERELAKVREEKQTVVTKVVREVRRELVSQPNRSCGWTDSERLSLNTAYCSSFPKAPTCLPVKVPDGSGATK